MEAALGPDHGHNHLSVFVLVSHLILRGLQYFCLCTTWQISCRDTNYHLSSLWGWICRSVPAGFRAAVWGSAYCSFTWTPAVTCVLGATPTPRLTPAETLVCFLISAFHLPELRRCTGLFKQSRIFSLYVRFTFPNPGHTLVNRFKPAPRWI